MEDVGGMRIKLFQAQVKVKGEYVDCLRVRNIPSSKLSVINQEELQILTELIKQTSKVEEEYCAILKIEKLADLPAHRYKTVHKKLLTTIEADKNENN